MTSQEQRRLRKRDRFRQLLGLENRPPSPASPSTGIPSDASQALSTEQNRNTRSAQSLNLAYF
ncbi:hypothetical protein BDV98DRAFT_568588 [Pterulicium gracile]|uniref:Uncharacterized protein n=1 Tax=Pterulicium gracile TaxID=1884261 RepID=A0A5C3QIP0_9AGAR|nr:hypothetical protein BDV98DRAFT_568588 [Pterula gracilis]